MEENFLILLSKNGIFLRLGIFHPRHFPGRATSEGSGIRYFVCRRPLSFYSTHTHNLHALCFRFISIPFSLYLLFTLTPNFIFQKYKED
jgi:hypothetical protein